MNTTCIRPLLRRSQPRPPHIHHQQEYQDQEAIDRKNAASALYVQTLVDAGGPSAPIAITGKSSLVFRNVLLDRLLTLRANVGELDSVAVLVSPDHDTHRVNG